MGLTTKVAVWHGITDTHRFIVDVFHDEEQGLFVAKMSFTSPPSTAGLRGPGREPRMRFDQERLTSNELETLEGLTKKLIADRYGTIRLFDRRAI